MKQPLKNKKILLVGLGLLGGGVATARWLLKQGAKLTVTDIKTAEKLQSSLDALKVHEKNIKYVLGKHEESDFIENDIIVVNPDVSVKNSYIQLAIQNGKPIENELSLFCQYVPTSNIIAVTGTRGKSTTATWTHHLLKAKFPKAKLAGNRPEFPLLDVISECKKDTRLVLEVSSFHLETIGFNKNKSFAPNVSIITNIYQDHLNRHGTMNEYALAKANIFKNQTTKDALILNEANKYTPLFENQKPKTKILFFSSKSLKKGHDGIFLKGTKIIRIKKGKESLSFDCKEFIQKWGMHNLENLMASILAVEKFGLSDKQIISAITTLPQIKYRQEKIFDDGRVSIYNDTNATSPDATVAALRRFAKSKNLILIAGGTDRDLDFMAWFKAINKYVEKDNLIFLNGSATEKMKKALRLRSLVTYETLGECLDHALELSKGDEQSVILFSPGAKSFEKFKNEYDRGEKFEALVKQMTK